PKEAKEPIFCCGAHHKSANYHKRTVHQQHTKIYFKGHPQAGFILRRNAATSLFHCPKCDKSWAMATPIRLHIFQKCEGYAQYRSASSAKVEDEDTNDVSMSDVDSSPVKAPSTVQVPPLNAPIAPVQAQEQGTNDDKGKKHNIDNTSIDDVSGIKEKTFRPEAHSTPPENSSTQEPVASRSPIIVEPVLRPAVWSPVMTTHTARPPTTASISGFPSLGSVGSHPRSISSCSSGLSSRTLADAASVSHTIAIRFKSDPDDALSAPSGHRTRASLFSGSPSLPLPPPERPTAVRTFLDSLRRPLGHAAALFYKMGLVTEEDLTLICTMPEAWDEVGAALQAGGLTTIEWLVVKEAFKWKAKGLARQNE
ncbi:hypothetical protein C8Q77DRAFT_1044694, partial [Trametes polyzona]